MHQHINGVKTVLPNRVVTATVNVKVAPTSIHSCCDGLTHGALQLECITCSVRVGAKTRCSFIIGNLPVRDTLVKPSRTGQQDTGHDPGNESGPESREGRQLCMSVSHTRIVLPGRSSQLCKLCLPRENLRRKNNTRTVRSALTFIFFHQGMRLTVICVLLLYRSGLS